MWVLNKFEQGISEQGRILEKNSQMISFLTWASQKICKAHGAFGPYANRPGNNENYQMTQDTFLNRKFLQYFHQSFVLSFSLSLVLGLWVSFPVKINQINWSKLNNLDFGCRMRPLSKWLNVTHGNEDQTVTMPKIEMNSENFYFEHDKHPATNNIKEEPKSIKVSI